MTENTDAQASFRNEGIVFMIIANEQPFKVNILMNYHNGK